MMSKKPQTIQGFLTPTKLLSGGSKYKKLNSKDSKFPLGGNMPKQPLSNSRFNSQNESFMNQSRDLLSHINHFNQTNEVLTSRVTGENVNAIVNQPDRKYQSEGNIPFSYPQKNYRQEFQTYNKNSVPISDQQDLFYKQRTLEQINNRKWDSAKVRVDNAQLASNNLKLKSDQTASFKKISSKYPINQETNGLSTQQKSSINTSNTIQVLTMQCYDLIRKLSKIKQNLQLQILQLQTLLDNTSKHMDNIDSEFQKIKQSILAYTAKSLDNAFTEYKESMIEWQKYEDFERKSLTMLTTMSQFIILQEKKMSQNPKLSTRQMTTKAQQLQGQIKYYGQFTQQIKQIRQQCISMRPTLTQDRLREFQKGVSILCTF